MFEQKTTSLISALALIVALWVGSSGCGYRSPPRHLVLIVMDTVRADRMSFYGYGRPTTPFLDSKSSELVRYEGVKAPAPWTIPAHASLLTGLRPATHGAQWGSMVLDEDFVTLAEILGAEGFCSVGFSSNPLVGPNTGLEQGFDAFEVVRGPWEDQTQKIEDRFGRWLVNTPTETCRSFLFLNLMDAHIPYNARAYGESFGLARAAPLATSKEKWQVSAGQRDLSLDEARQLGVAYDAAVRYLDDVLSHLFMMLENRGILDETLIVITSDHGEGLGIHQEVGHSVSLWEEQLAIPFIVRQPHGRRGGSSVAGPSSLTGAITSILRWLEVPMPTQLEGLSGLGEPSEAPVTADYRSYFGEESRTVNRTVQEAYPELARRVTNGHAVYCNSLKLVIWAGRNPVFYDLRMDPDEQTMLGIETPGSVECLDRHRRAVEEGWLTALDSGDQEMPRSAQPNLDDLRSLGYLN